MVGASRPVTIATAAAARVGSGYVPCATPRLPAAVPNAGQICQDFFAGPGSGNQSIVIFQAGSGRPGCRSMAGGIPGGCGPAPVAPRP